MMPQSILQVNNDLLVRLDERVSQLIKDVNDLKDESSETKKKVASITDRVNGGFYVLIGLGGLVTFTTGLWNKFMGVFK